MAKVLTWGLLLAASARAVCSVPVAVTTDLPAASPAPSSASSPADPQQSTEELLRKQAEAQVQSSIVGSGLVAERPLPAQDEQGRDADPPLLREECKKQVREQDQEQEELDDLAEDKKPHAD
jgi:hypothetical protein